jgi:hypothetical protein
LSSRYENVATDLYLYSRTGTTMEDMRPGEDLDAYMARSLESVLARLEEPDVVSDHKVSSPDLKFEESTSADLKDDPLNAASVSTSVNHTVRTAPNQVAHERNLVTPEVFWDVPIRKAQPTSFVPAVEPVIHSVSGTDVGFQQFLNLTRNANAGAKRNGSLAASIAYTLGQDGVTVTDGSPVAVASRVTAARLAAEQGATASAQPSDGPLDVIWAPISDVGAAEDANQDAFAVYMPSGLSPGAMSALASLLVPGGPGAYTWRYRPHNVNVPPDPGAVANAVAHNAAHPDNPMAMPVGYVDHEDDARAHFMPAVSRHMHSGGHNFLLVVTERRDVVLPAVGGASLTVNNLAAIEAFYRRWWGHEVWDAAWRGTLAMAAVYREPTLEPAGVLDVGENFELRRASHSIGGQNMHDDIFTWTGPQTPHAAGGDMALPTDAIDNTRHGTSQEIKDIGWAVCRQHDPGLPRRFNEALLDATGLRYLYRPLGGDDDEAVDRGWDDVFRQDLRALLGDRQRRLLRATYLHLTHMTMPMGLDVFPDDEGAEIDETTIIRNVFGARDHARLELPGLAMVEVIGLIANYTQPARRKAVHSTFSRPTRKNRASNYASHLHLANYFNFVKGDVWPCDLKTFPRKHSAYIRMLRPALRPWCWMDSLMPDYYQEQNWVVLESSGMIRNASSAEPFAGTLVPGTWPANSSGIVDLTDGRVNFCAVEAAFRNSTNDGGPISAVGRFGADAFWVVRGNNGTVHSLGFAPRIDTPRGTAGVQLHADGGINTLQPGANVAAPIYSVF